MHIGRPDEARATLERFGSVIVTETDDWDDEAKIDHSHLPPADRRYLGTTDRAHGRSALLGFREFRVVAVVAG